MGFIYLMQNLPQERISIAIMAAAGMESVLEQTLQYAKERKAFGRSIGSFQNSRFCWPSWQPRPLWCASWSTNSLSCTWRGS